MHEFYFDADGKGKKRGMHPKFHVLLTSYELMRADSAHLRKFDWEALVVDEGHRLKNIASKSFQTLFHFETKRMRIILTGTPLQNNIGEMFNLLAFLEPKKFAHTGDLETEFESLGESQKVEKLHGLLRPHILRRLKQDVIHTIPSKVRIFDCAIIF